MAYTLPTFPVQAGIYTSGQTNPGALRRKAGCNVAFGKRTPVQFWNWSDDLLSSIFVHLLFPPATDVRDCFSTTGPDAIQVPLGSGRWYKVCWVDDIALGFPNEHRYALAQKFGPWPTPLPGVYAEVVPGRGAIPLVRRSVLTEGDPSGIGG